MEREKNFLMRKAEEEERSVSAIVRGALKEKYKEFGEIVRKGDEKKLFKREKECLY